MKKFIILLLAALMIVGLCISCKEDPKPTFSFIGTWESSVETEGGIRVTTLEMKEDNSFTLETTIDEIPAGSLAGTYEVKDGKLIATLDADSSAKYADVTITAANPMYVFFKDTAIQEGPETAIMGTEQSTEDIEIIVSTRILPEDFAVYALDDTTLSNEGIIGNFFYSVEFTPDVFSDEVSKIDYSIMEGINDESGSFIASNKVAGHYDASIIHESFTHETHNYYIFCKATKDNVSEVVMTSIYEEVDLTHFKASLGEDEMQTFTKK